MSIISRFWLLLNEEVSLAERKHSPSSSLSDPAFKNNCKITVSQIAKPAVSVLSVELKRDHLL